MLPNFLSFLVAVNLDIIVDFRERKPPNHTITLKISYFISNKTDLTESQ